MSNDKNKWSQPAAPPPPLFVGQKERNLIKQVNDELIEDVMSGNHRVAILSALFSDKPRIHKLSPCIWRGHS